jgi:sensor histidine kinase YesM
MIRDKLIRMVFIPLLGIIISYVSGIITYSEYSTIEIIGSLIYFMFISLSIWKGSQWIHLKLRQFYTVDQNPFLKTAYVCMISGLYGIAVSGMLGLTWLRFSKETFSWSPLIQMILFSLLAVIVFTLVYEIVYLSQERERDTKMVVQLDQELTRAEMIALRNELDPHFIFNSLTALSYLISNDTVKADLFNRKLAEVYKYFLINKEKELVSVEKEIDFIRDYFFLLTIRHDNKLKLHLHLGEISVKNFFVVPCALQILVENAIKHNQFTHEQPLHIYVLMDTEYLIVKNNNRLKQARPGTTKIGLKNLGTQYRLLAGKKIIVEESQDNFIVKLPLIRTEDKLIEKEQ